MIFYVIIGCNVLKLTYIVLVQIFPWLLPLFTVTRFVQHNNLSFIFIANNYSTLSPMIVFFVFFFYWYNTYKMSCQQDLFSNRAPFPFLRNRPYSLCSTPPVYICCLYMCLEGLRILKSIAITGFFYSITSYVFYVCVCVMLACFIT